MEVYTFYGFTISSTNSGVSTAGTNLSSGVISLSEGSDTLLIDFTAPLNLSGATTLTSASDSEPGVYGSQYGAINETLDRYTVGSSLGINAITPEPSSLTLVGLGAVIGAGAWSRRGRRSKTC